MESKAVDHHLGINRHQGRIKNVLKDYPCGLMGLFGHPFKFNILHADLIGPFIGRHWTGPAKTTLGPIRRIGGVRETLSPEI